MWSLVDLPLREAVEELLDADKRPSNRAERGAEAEVHAEPECHVLAAARRTSKRSGSVYQRQPGPSEQPGHGLVAGPSDQRDEVEQLVVLELAGSVRRRDVR